MADSVIDRMKASKNKLLVAEGKALSIWGKLSHNKEGLELFLTHNIAEIRFKPGKSDKYESLVLTGNNRLIKVYSALKPEDKKKFLASPFAGIRTKDPLTVDAYDLAAGKVKTISLRAWQILNFVTITEENVEVLDALVRECLRR